MLAQGLDRWSITDGTEDKASEESAALTSWDPPTTTPGFARYCLQSALSGHL